MSTSATKTPSKSPTAKKDSPSFKSPLLARKITDLENKEKLTASDKKLKQTVEGLKEYTEKYKDEIIISFTSFFETLEDKELIPIREAYKMYLKKLDPNTPKLHLKNHFSPSDRPTGNTLFPTLIQDIPPEVKSDTKPAAIETGTIKQTTTSTGTGSSDPPKENTTSGSNGIPNPPSGGNNGGQPNPPSGGNDGDNNKPPSPPHQGNNSWSGGGGEPPAPSSSSNHTKPPPNGPIMGGWKWLGTYHEPWTGGKPNCWWTGLDNPVTDTNNPNYLRGSGPKCTSAYNARRQGLYKDDPDRRFSESGDLDDFCKQLKHSFNNNGLNTIAYRNDPSDADKMLYVLEEYPRLHSKTIKTQTSLCKPKWDHYDKENDEAARKFLLESLQEN